MFTHPPLLNTSDIDMTASPLNLQPNEPDDDDPLCLEFYPILRDALQPDTKTPIEDTVGRIVAFIPEGDLYIDEAGLFYQTCYEIAEQIPFNHPSMIKLVDIMDQCIHAPKFFKRSEEQLDSWRYAKLGETLGDDWECMPKPDEKPDRYINYSTFLALVDAQQWGPTTKFGVWALEEAFAGPDSKIWGLPETKQGRNACMTAALQYLLISGEVMHELLRKLNTPEKWRDWHGNVSAVAAGQPLPNRSQKSRWKGWVEKFLDETANEKERRDETWPPDIIQRAREAQVAMEAIDPCKPIMTE